jgi:phosphoglycolate phosphatase-like HAD superfamily hydrolase
LFDIDGTLLKCFGAGKKSLIQACEEVFGTSGAMDTVDFQGKTDPMILLESLESRGLSEDHIGRNLEALKARYFHHLRINLYDGAPVLLPGVNELLRKLSRVKTILLGLLTGNFRESAAIKLGRFDLNRYFSFGVFGDDAAFRNHMPAIARKIIRDEFGIDMPFKDIIIVGDTLYDIDCAKSAGAVSISVGTGWIPKEELLSRAPDFFFDDLEDTDRILEAILG